MFVPFFLPPEDPPYVPDPTAGWFLPRSSSLDQVGHCLEFVWTQPYGAPGGRIWALEGSVEAHRNCSSHWPLSRPSDPKGVTATLNPQTAPSSEVVAVPHSVHRQPATARWPFSPPKGRGWSEASPQVDCFLPRGTCWSKLGVSLVLFDFCKLYLCQMLSQATFGQLYIWPPKDTFKKCSEQLYLQ